MISLDKLLDVRGITYGIMLVKSNRFDFSEAVHYNPAHFWFGLFSDTRLRFDDIYSKNMRQFDEGKSENRVVTIINFEDYLVLSYTSLSVICHQGDQLKDASIRIML